ncbi:MAG: putative DNA base hypermodification protein [Candidatus Thiodiazotropha taylori]|uniref:5-hmdU DNA kinase helical domain-containing protein n=1 Tax=Candidatus Thiodiazotropha taylori TaxID=2792791 RepID=A0A9E4KA03_9GAMM|nr:hypothetical protein [Candidatus Thiodiazotropha taylori]MCW4254952.1 putative DNA base hypermodification protein [Candidatus Thiodiazotropha taylori]
MGGSINQNVLQDLKLDDPMGQLMDFSEERQNIYLRRKSNKPQPWTDDKTLQTYKFCNVFRDQDRTTEFILDWVSPLKNQSTDLVANLIYARMCNNPRILEMMGFIHEIAPEKFIQNISMIGGGKTKSKVNKNTVWKDPYQIAGAFKKRLGYPYREHVIAYHIPKTAADLTRSITNYTKQDLSELLDKMADDWGYKNNMVFTNALLDISHIRPDLVSEDVIYPLGDGATPLLKLFDVDDPYEIINELVDRWNSKGIHRRMRPMDAESAMCEFRKYLVWKNSLAKKYRLFKPYPTQITLT